MHRIESRNFAPFLSTKCVLSNSKKILLITAAALCMIGLLAAVQAPGLNSLSSYWACFSLAGFATLIIEKFYCERLCCTRYSEPFSLPQEPEDLFTEGRKFEINKQDAQAFLCYLIASSRGHHEAHFFLAHCYAQGKGCAGPNIPLAMTHFKIMATGGHVESIINLALLYLDQHKEDKALFWLKKIESEKLDASIESFETDSKVNRVLAVYALRGLLAAERNTLATERLEAEALAKSSESSE